LSPEKLKRKFVAFNSLTVSLNAKKNQPINFSEKSRYFTQKGEKVKKGEITVIYLRN
jgi:hypothetical protein